MKRRCSTVVTTVRGHLVHHSVSVSDTPIRLLLVFVHFSELLLHINEPYVLKSWICPVESDIWFVITSSSQSVCRLEAKQHRLNGYQVTQSRTACLIISTAQAPSLAKLTSSPPFLYPATLICVVLQISPVNLMRHPPSQS